MTPVQVKSFPASYAQSRLWFLQQLEPGLTAYDMPRMWRLRGALNVKALEAALAGLMERHATLRTSFRLYDGDVLQLIHPPGEFGLSVEELGQRDGDELLDQWMEQEHSTPFDLTSGVLLRARLLQVAHQEHVLLVNHHHIASDGWSLSLLTRDLAELYNAYSIGRSSTLARLRVHYHDYARWQRQRLSGDRLQALKGYWIPQLTGLEPLDLPSDHHRPATPSHRGASVAFQITPELLASFEELCRLEGATLQMGLLALLALLLHRYSRQEDFAIGVPVWGRSHPDLEPLIGFFTNTLPVRTRFTPQQSFRKLLQQVKASSLAAYDHQELPFEQMLESLNLERDTSRNPLVQVMLQLIELPEASLINFEGLAVDAIPSKSESSKLDLSFYLRRSADHGLQGSIAYATDLFSSDRMERFCSHLLTLLSSALAAPDSPAASLCLLPDAERQLIASWQQGPTIDIPDLCVHQRFEAQVERTADAIALIFEDQQLTYQELNARSNQLAHHLIALGVGPEVIVAVSLERSVELIVSLLAILKAGGAYLPIDPNWPKERQALLLKEAACSVLLNQSGATILDDPRPQEGIASGPPLAYVTYTSGSTGKPKGVAISHNSILRLVDPVNGFLLSAGYRVLQLAPVAFDAATFEIWGPLLNGGTLVVAPPEQPTSSALSALLKNHGITTLWLTAGLFHAMGESELPTLAGVQQVIAGGDVLSVEHVQRLLDAFPSGHELINGYGPTENTTFTCCHHFEGAATVDPNGVAIGRPIANTEVRVLDDCGLLCPLGIPGELHIGGAGLARGYLNNLELTAEKFISDPFSSDPTARLYKSGDLASWNPDGTVAFHGRIDQQIKLRGFRIEPGEIEVVLHDHPSVAQAVVVLRKDDPANPRLIAYWVPQESIRSTPAFEAAVAPAADQLRSFILERLPDYMVPSAFVELAALPLNANGKLDRKALPAPSFAGDKEQRVEPSTDLERQLHAIWAEVLGHSEFGCDDNFWMVGGHSLAAASLVVGIEQSVGRAVAWEVIYRYPTISGQSAWLRDRASAAPRHLVTLQPQGSRPPLYIVHGWGGRVGSFTNLARALAPDRPVLGLQASPDAGPPPPGASVSQMTQAYAEEILAAHRGGPIHLMGFSAGGWYAYAVADALIQRHAQLGVIAILDTHIIAQIDPRLGLSLFTRGLISKLLGKQRRAHRQFSSRSLKDWLIHFNSMAGLYFGVRIPAPQSLAARLRGFAPPLGRGEPFVQLLRGGYRPPRLPLVVDLFSPQAHLPECNRLWRFYALGGVRCWPLFADHNDYEKPEFTMQLAAALENALISMESRHQF